MDLQNPLSKVFPLAVVMGLTGDSTVPATSPSHPAIDVSLGGGRKSICIAYIEMLGLGSISLM